jgi:hypothetical protein
MNVYVQCFVMIPFVVVMFQFYSWIVSLEGTEKQKHCNVLGIIYTTLGTVCFMFRSLSLAIVGLILFMLGLRLIAHGLDRLNKTIFIDQFAEDRPTPRLAGTDTLKVALVTSLPSGVTQVSEVEKIAVQPTNEMQIPHQSILI